MHQGGAGNGCYYPEATHTTGSYAPLPLGVILREIKALLNVAVDSVKIPVCPRSC
jgi:hypothetical protein